MSRLSMAVLYAALLAFTAQSHARADAPEASLASGTYILSLTCNGNSSETDKFPN